MYEFFCHKTCAQEVPAKCKYGIQTQHSLLHYAIKYLKPQFYETRAHRTKSLIMRLCNFCFITWVIAQFMVFPIFNVKFCLILHMLFFLDEHMFYYWRCTFFLWIFRWKGKTIRLDRLTAPSTPTLCLLIPNNKSWFF